MYAYTFICTFVKMYGVISCGSIQKYLKPEKIGNAFPLDISDEFRLAIVLLSSSQAIGAFEPHSTLADGDSLPEVFRLIPKRLQSINSRGPPINMPMCRLAAAPGCVLSQRELLSQE